MAGRILGVHDAKPASELFPAYWGREFVSKKGGGALPESTTAGQLVQAVLDKARPHLAAGGGCVVSIKAPMMAAGRGAWDSRFSALGAACAGAGIILVPWHEPEDDLKPTVFVPAHNRLRDVLKGAARDLEVAYAGMAYQWRPGSKTTADAAAWAADLQADLYLADVYSGKTFQADAILPEHPGWVRWHTEMIAAYPGRRWGIAERGILAGPTRAQTIAREAEWLATDPIGRTCELYLWWNTGGTEANPGWVLDREGEHALASLLSRVAAADSGYRPSVLDGFLISERSGCLVAADLTAQHDRLLRALQG